MNTDEHRLEKLFLVLIRVHLCSSVVPPLFPLWFGVSSVARKTGFSAGSVEGGGVILM
jgi:hypothetical protein